MPLDEKVEAAFGKTWILYHCAGALAARLQKDAPRYAESSFSKVSTEIHLFVLSACSACQKHHTEYLQLHPAKLDYERWVFDLHNAVNHRRRKPEIPDAEFEAVRAHYRAQLARLGRRATATLLTQRLPIVSQRYCYDCGGAL